jgi:hypothetical protein
MSPTTIRTDPDSQPALLRAVLRELRILNQLAARNDTDYAAAVKAVDSPESETATEESNEDQDQSTVAQTSAVDSNDSKPSGSADDGGGADPNAVTS